MLRELAVGQSALLRALEPMIGRREVVAEDTAEDTAEQSWGVAASTVEGHVRSAMRKSGARTRWQAAMVATDDRLLAGRAHG